MQKIHLIPQEVSLIAAVTAWLVDQPEVVPDDSRHFRAILAEHHTPEALHAAGQALENNFNGPGFCWIEGPVDACTADILRVSVEHNNLLEELSTDRKYASVAEGTVDALRSLAFKLEELGIEVNQFPPIPDIAK